MKRPSFGTLLSLLANIFLSLWLVNQYLYDQYFRGYVNNEVSPLLPYLVLTIGIGGGSGLGYALLRRRPSDIGISGRLQKSRPMKPSGPLLGPSGSPLQSKNVPVGTPPGPVSKHTVYSVPSLSKSPSPAPQRATPPTSWASTPSQSTPGSTPGQRTEPRTQPGPQSSSTSTFGGFGEDLKRTPVSSRPIEPAVSQWKPETKGEIGGSGRTTVPYTGVFPETTSRPAQNFAGPGQSTDRAPQPPAAFQPQKWQPPETGSKPPQWNDPVPKQSYLPPQKWAPPPVSPVPSSRPSSPIGPQARPGQTPQGRPPFPGPQGPPRPLTYPGSMRPPPGGSVPGMFRPDQRPGFGVGGQQRPDSPGQKTNPPHWNPQTSERQEFPSSLAQSSSQSQSSTQTQPEPTGTSASSEGSGPPSSGEMDWDTALDTILKTLRKDKVGDKP